MSHPNTERGVAVAVRGSTPNYKPNQERLDRAREMGAKAYENKSYRKGCPLTRAGLRAEWMKGLAATVTPKQ